MTQTGGPIQVFFSYSHKDEKLRDKLAVHLATLKREGAISEWHDRKIGAGHEWAGEIDAHLEAAHVILLLVSPEFLASDYCNDIEVKTAMRRHEAEEARVVPVILRPCDWTTTPFAKLQALPKDGKPVTEWSNRDRGFLDVAQGIRRVAEEMVPRVVPAPAAAPQKASVSSTIPRSPAIDFVVRRDEGGRDILKRLREELSPEQGRLVALWGPGGSGKTTLAAEAARALSAAFPGRVVWTSALGRADFTLSTLLDEIATQLGHPEFRQKAIEEKEAEVRSLVVRAPTLAILDNFEAVPHAGGSDEQSRCLDFLASCGESPALLTTRDFVNRVEVVNVRLAAMEDDEGREFLGRLVEQSGRPKAFRGLDHDELIKECDGNPLVMQWVVSQVALAQRVRDVLDDLKKGEGYAAERVFDRSFMLPQVGEDGRAALLALSLFAPNASRVALAYVAGFGDSLRRLNRAIEKLSALWLVEATESNERLFLHGLTHELTRSRLERDDRATDFYERFITYFVAYAGVRQEQSPENYDSLEQEKNNLLSTIDLAFARKDWESVDTIASICAVPFPGAVSVRGFWNEAIALNDRALQAVRVIVRQELVARFSQHQEMREEWGKAWRLLVESLEISNSSANEHVLARALHNLAIFTEVSGDLDEAHRLYHKSLYISRRIEDEDMIGGTVHHIATLALMAGRVDEARRMYQESLDIHKKLGNWRGIGQTNYALATLALEIGDLDEARRLYQEGLPIQKKLRNESGVAQSFLGRLAHKEGNFEEARRLYTESLSISRRMRNHLGEAFGLAQLAHVEAQLGNLSDAVDHSKQAEEIMIQLGHKKNLSFFRDQREAFELLLREREAASHDAAAGRADVDRHP